MSHQLAVCANKQKTQRLKQEMPCLFDKEKNHIELHRGPEITFHKNLMYNFLNIHHRHTDDLPLEE